MVYAFTRIVITFGLMVFCSFFWVKYLDFKILYNMITYLISYIWIVGAAIESERNVHFYRLYIETPMRRRSNVISHLTLIFDIRVLFSVRSYANPQTNNHPARRANLRC